MSEPTSDTSAPTVITAAEMAPGVVAAPTTSTTNAATPEATDWKAEAEKWKALSRANEKKATANESAAARLQKIEEAGKSELEKATARAEAAEKKAADIEAGTRERLAESAVLAAAAKANASDPELVWMAASKSDLQFDDSGRLTNAAAVVAAVLKARPALAGKTATREARDSGTPAAGSDMNTLIRRAAGVRT